MNLLEIDARLKDLVNEFIQNWNEGQRKTFEVGIYELGIRPKLWWKRNGTL